MRTPLCWWRMTSVRHKRAKRSFLPKDTQARLPLRSTAVMWLAAGGGVKIDTSAVDLSRLSGRGRSP